jgi:hypothetical protein
MSISQTRRRRAAIALATTAAVLATSALAAGASGTGAGSAREAAAESARPTRHAAVGVAVTTTMTDLDDTRGRLDVRSVRHRVSQVSPRRVQVSYRIRTFAPYRDGLLESPEREFVIELHRTATRGADRNISVSSVDGALVATVISNATRKPIARARIVRLDAQTFRIVGSRALIGARSYFVTSNFHAGGSARCGWNAGWPVTCQDSVPDNGWIRVDRIGWPDVR